RDAVCGQLAVRFGHAPILLRSAHQQMKDTRVGYRGSTTARPEQPNNSGDPMPKVAAIRPWHLLDKPQGRFRQLEDVCLRNCKLQALVANLALRLFKFAD